MRFGNSNITRVELKALGARVHGGAISTANTNMRAPDQTFIDGLSFDPAKVETRVKSATKTPDSGIVATLFFEISISRSVDAPPLFAASAPLTPDSPIDRLNKLGQSAQKLDIHAIQSDSLLKAKAKSYAHRGVATVGVGMQAFGIYSGFKGAFEALNAGDTGEAVFNGVSIGAEFGSLIIERGLTKGWRRDARERLSDTQTVFRHVSRYRIQSGWRVICQRDHLAL